MNALFQAQFNYCSLVSMLPSHKLINKIACYIKMPACYLQGHEATFEQLLEIDNSVSIYYKNLIVLGYLIG